MDTRVLPYIQTNSSCSSSAMGPSDGMSPHSATFPWGHNVELLSTLDAPSDRVWYAEQAIAHGWSRNVLAAQIMSKLHLRTGVAPSNFSTALLPSESELVQQLIKDRKRYVVVELKRSAFTPEAAGKGSASSILTLADRCTPDHMSFDS